MMSSSFEETRPDQMMETLHFACRKCAMQLTVPMQLAGVSGPCPGCGETIAAPAQPLPEWRSHSFAEVTVSNGTLNETPSRTSGITALPSAATGKNWSHFDMLLRSTAMRFALYLAVLAAVVTYFGIPKPGRPRPQSVVAQLQPAPVSEQRTVVSTTSKDVYPDSPVNMEPRFSAASRWLPSQSANTQGR